MQNNHDKGLAKSNAFLHVYKRLIRASLPSNNHGAFSATPDLLFQIRERRERLCQQMLWHLPLMAGEYHVYYIL